MSSSQISQKMHWEDQSQGNLAGGIHGEIFGSDWIPLELFCEDTEKPRSLSCGKANISHRDELAKNHGYLEFLCPKWFTAQCSKTSRFEALSLLASTVFWCVLIGLLSAWKSTFSTKVLGKALWRFLSWPMTTLSLGIVEQMVSLGSGLLKWTSFIGRRGS